MTAVAPKKPLTCIHVTLRARWYRSASIYLLDISREALAANRYTDKKWHQMTADKAMSTLTKTSLYVTGSDS